MGIINTVIRGYVYDFSSVSLTIGGKMMFCTFQDINYNWSRDIGVLRGNGSGMKKGRTRGEFDFKGSITLSKSDAMIFQSALATQGLPTAPGTLVPAGFGETVFNIVVVYAEKGQAHPDRDVLIGCTLVGGDDSHGRSPDPLVVKYDLDIMDITYNGISPASTDAFSGVAGVVGGIIG